MKNLIGETNSKVKNTLWFEKENFKFDKDYCQIISSNIDIMILHFNKNKTLISKNSQREFCILQKIITILIYLNKQESYLERLILLKKYLMMFIGLYNF